MNFELEPPNGTEGCDPRVTTLLLKREQCWWVVFGRKS